MLVYCSFRDNTKKSGIIYTLIIDLCMVRYNPNISTKIWYSSNITFFYKIFYEILAAIRINF